MILIEIVMHGIVYPCEKILVILYVYIHMSIFKNIIKTLFNPIIIDLN